MPRKTKPIPKVLLVTKEISAEDISAVSDMIVGPVPTITKEQDASPEVAAALHEYFKSEKGYVGLMEATVETLVDYSNCMKYGYIPVFLSPTNKTLRGKVSDE
jgi:hypothetical protein